MAFNENLKRIRKEKGLTQAELANLMNVKQPSISQWELGEIEPSSGVIQRLAESLDVDPGELMQSHRVREEPARFGSDFVRLPVICKIAAGNPALACECDHGYMDVPARDARNAALVKIKGDSMTPYLLNGDVVLVKLDPTPEPGRVVVARKNLDGELTVKRLKKVGQMLFLQPENPAFDPLVFDPREEWQLVGYVKKLIDREIK